MQIFWLAKDRWGSGDAERRVRVRLVLQERDVNVFEKLAGDDAKQTIGKFNEVVAAATGMPAAQAVSEGEAGSKLPGFDQETGAIGDPRIGCFHEFNSRQLSVVSSRFSVVRSRWPAHRSRWAMIATQCSVFVPGFCRWIRFLSSGS
jgi:hypothetical protein